MEDRGNKGRENAGNGEKRRDVEDGGMRKEEEVGTACEYRPIYYGRRMKRHRWKIYDSDYCYASGDGGGGGGDRHDVTPSRLGNN